MAHSSLVEKAAELREQRRSNVKIDAGVLQDILETAKQLEEKSEKAKEVGLSERELSRLYVTNGPIFIRRTNNPEQATVRITVADELADEWKQAIPNVEFQDTDYGKQIVMGLNLASKQLYKYTRGLRSQQTAQNQSQAVDLERLLEAKKNSK